MKHRAIPDGEPMDMYYAEQAIFSILRGEEQLAKYFVDNISDSYLGNPFIGHRKKLKRIKHLAKLFEDKMGSSIGELCLM